MQFNYHCYQSIGVPRDLCPTIIVKSCPRAIRLSQRRRSSACPNCMGNCPSTVNVITRRENWTCAQIRGKRRGKETKLVTWPGSLILLFPFLLIFVHAGEKGPPETWEHDSSHAPPSHWPQRHGVKMVTKTTVKSLLYLVYVKTISTMSSFWSRNFHWLDLTNWFLDFIQTDRGNNLLRSLSFYKSSSWS